MNNLHSLLIVAVIAVVTYILRGAAFVLFPKGKEIPRFVQKLGSVLPYGIMGLLVVYCLKDVSITSAPFGLPELIAVLSVIILQALKRNSLLSILISTILYMIMVQFIF